MEERKYSLSEEYRQAEQMFSPFNWLQGEIKDLRQEIRDLRQALSASESGLRQEIAALETGLRQEIAAFAVSLRQEIKQELSGVRALVWATLTLVAGTLALVVSVFLR